MIISDALVEQHIHGAFGIDFMNCAEDELLYTAEKLAQNGVGYFFPTIMTDSIEKIKERISVVKKAKQLQKYNSAQIAGIHLEGPFINPQKAGIHPKNYICSLDEQIYKQIDDEIIKIITLAPELDLSGNFINYLRNKNIKISLGHSLGNDLSQVNQVTHLYNAMGAFSHRGESSCGSALANDNIYTELIADSLHVNDDVLKITFKTKPSDKILIISDALPLAHSDKAKLQFACQVIYNKDGKLVNSDGIFAGSSMLLCDMVKNLAEKQLLKFEDVIKYTSSNQLKYHNLKNNLKVYWNDDYTIQKVEFV